MANLPSDEERPLLIHHLPPQEQCSQYTCDGTVDIDKRPALKQCTGNWRACFFILGAEFTQCLCFSAVVKNLVRYLTSVLQESNVDAAQSVSTWIGTCFFTPLIGAFLADTFWGRYKTVVICLSVYTIGMLVLTISASLPFLLHDFYNNGDIRRVVTYLGLYLIALGAGGIKPCISALGADQFDGADPVERVTKGSFFNYYYFTNNMGTLLSTTVLVWVQDNIGWDVGFATPMLLMGFGLSMFVAGKRVYRYRKLGRSPLTRVSQVVVAAVRNHSLKLPDDSSLLHELPSPTEGGYRIQHTTRFRFLDKAAIPSDGDDNSPAQRNPWRLCTVSQVEELKMLLRVFPVWASLLVFFVVTAQMSSTLIEQSTAMDGRVGPFTVPPASLATFNVVGVLIWVPVYDAVLVPLARRVTGNDRGLSHLQRIGVGLALSAVAMAYSAQVERRRRRLAAEAMSMMWQAPCYLVLGMAEVFTSIGMLEFFYEGSPESMKSLGTSLAHLAVATANYLNSGVLGVVAAATTRGGGAGWIPDNLDEGHLDYFFWMMALLSHHFHCICIFPAFIVGSTLGTGGTLCTSALRADQFDVTDLLIFSAGATSNPESKGRVYWYNKAKESPMKRDSRVIVASVRNRHLQLPDDSSTLHELPLTSESNCKTHHTGEFSIRVALCTIPMVYSALLESKCFAAMTNAMSIMWHAPSYLIFSAAELFDCIGMIELFYI
uniref:Major facilitator superfamily (MFS) profile domain-containing protein n=1 Tax=Oryza punctata TaxID=4537 RepID=A0A0E0M4Z6_ORYPU